MAPPLRPSAVRKHATPIHVHQNMGHVFSYQPAAPPTNIVLKIGARPPESRKVTSGWDIVLVRPSRSVCLVRVHPTSAAGLCASTQYLSTSHSFSAYPGFLLPIILGNNVLKGPPDHRRK